MNPWHLRKGLRAIIILLIKTHPAAFRVLLGDYVPPSANEICDMLGALCDDADPEVRVDCGSNVLPDAIKLIETAEKFNSYINAAGGWPHINKIVREWARHYASTWDMIIDHAVWVEYGTSRTDTAQLMQLEHKHGISRVTIWRRLKEFPGMLSNAIIAQPPNGKVHDIERQKESA